MQVLDLFSAAAGGWSLGMHRAGFTTIAACEVEAWRRALYSENNPGVKVYDDVRTLTADRLLADLGRLPSIVVGSPPCQDISSANTKGKGVEGERSGLYFEAIRIIDEVRARWFALENSANLRTRGADAVIAALEAIGYACWPVVVRAGDVGANHERPRCWLIGCDLAQVADVDAQGFGYEGGWSRGHGSDGISAPPVAGSHAGDTAQDGCRSGLPWGRAEPAERLSIAPCGDAGYANSESCPTGISAETAEGSYDHGSGRLRSDPEHGGGRAFPDARDTPDPDQAGQADGCMVPGIRQAEIANDGRCAGRCADGQGAGQMGLCAPDRGDPDGGWADWSLRDLTSHVWLDARLQAWAFLAILLEEGGMRWEGERLIAAVKSAEHVEQPSLDSDLASALRIVLASYSATTARRLAPIAETMLDGCSITIAPDATWEKPAKSAKAQTASRSITLTKTGPTATPPTSRPSAHPAIPVTICEQDLWAVHQRAERRLRLFASRQVEAFGDAVIPQIPEAIGKAILRTEAALAAIYGRAAA